MLARLSRSATGPSGAQDYRLMTGRYRVRVRHVFLHAEPLMVSLSHRHGLRACRHGYLNPPPPSHP